MGLARTVIAVAKRAARAILASEVRTHMPAQVVSYNPTLNTCVVQPTIKAIRTEDPNNLATVLLPQIADVPVQQFGSGTLVITVPPIAGSYGLLHVSDRDIDSWLLKGGIVDPASSRKFNSTDSVFYPGLYPMVPPFAPPVNIDRIEMRNSLGTSYIALTNTGSIEITGNSLGFLTIDIDGTITVENTLGDITLYPDGEVWINGGNLVVSP